LSAREGLYATVAYRGNTIALLRGVSLSWDQTKRRFYANGSLLPLQILRGIIAWDMGWKEAFTTTAHMGTFNVGTEIMVGTIFPRGGTNPYIAGSICLNSGSLSNMEAENEAAVEEEHSAMIYNMTFQD